MTGSRRSRGVCSDLRPVRPQYSKAPRVAPKSAIYGRCGGVWAVLPERPGSMTAREVVRQDRAPRDVEAGGHGNSLPPGRNSAAPRPSGAVGGSCRAPTGARGRIEYARLGRQPSTRHLANTVMASGKCRSRSADDTASRSHASRRFSPATLSATSRCGAAGCSPSSSA